MSNAPARIWASAGETWDGIEEGTSWDDGLYSRERENSYDVEYIRADLVPQWQPIETAPKDGTPVQVGWVDTFFHPITAHKEGSLWGVLGQNMEFTVLQVTPTHWMPTPTPPKER